MLNLIADMITAVVGIDLKIAAVSRPISFRSATRGATAASLPGRELCGLASECKMRAV